MLILMLTFPSVGIRTAVSQESEEEIKEEIKGELENLKSIILGLDRDFFNNSRSAEGNRRALINKIDAVISQVEHEAYKGTVEKLENDLKSVVKLWIKKDKAFELILIIEGIIELILKITLPPAPPPPPPPPFADTTPPNITSVEQEPETPSYDENVTVRAEVKDEESGVKEVILNYSINEKDWINITMEHVDGDLYRGEIPAYPFNTTVYYKVHAYDEAGNLAVSDVYSYTVIDPYNPEIAWVDRSPLSPNYNDTVLITANVSEPEEASGVQQVILSYFDGDAWTNVTMKLKDEDLYEETIPALPYDTTVDYKVYASDKAENWAVSSLYSYTVGDEYPPTVRIDKPTHGSYVKGIVDVVVYVFDDNFKMAELTINEKLVVSWTSTGTRIYKWDTEGFEDGSYIIKLIALDEAGNTAEETVRVTLDKKVPYASINAPAEGDYLKGLVIINFTGEDDNLAVMQLYINETLVMNLTASGTFTYPWNTTNLNGVFEITLKVYDKAENTAIVQVKVTVDNIIPTAEIRQPQEGAYLKDTVEIIVFGSDANFLHMELYINNNLSKTWTTDGEQTYNWSTSELPDGDYSIRLIVVDMAGNLAKEEITVTLDKTKPFASINTPKEGRYLKGFVVINFTGKDDNLKEMKLYINLTLVWTLNVSDTYTYPWNTSGLNGVFIITLEVYDKAGNNATVHRRVIVDNTPPMAEIKKPLENAYIKGVYEIVILGEDTNFAKMKLYIPNNITEFAEGEQTYPWDTSKVEDGSYTIKLVVSDKAGNIAESQVTVTVDNTLPTGKFNLPTEGAFLKGSVTISITGEDANLEKMQLYIGANLKLTISAIGTYQYVWNTLTYNDGDYTLKLEVTDKAKNTFTTEIQVTVDNTPPEAEIIRPISQEYISGSIVFKIYGADANFEKMLFYIGEDVFSEVYESGEYSSIWNTWKYTDGTYQIKLVVSDKAGNLAEKVIFVTVDNTLPAATIHTPSEKAILKGTVLVNVTGSDDNFKEMELKIDDIKVKGWTEAGNLVYLWDTTAYLDGNYTIALVVYDKANNTKEASVVVTVDNTAPVIMAPTWIPKEPSINELVIVTAKVTDPYPGSGIKTVILWFRNATMEDWHALLMSLDVESGNWTTTIPAQSLETTVRFYIEAFDKADNKAVREEIDEYKVTLPPAGFPLAWIAALILIILTATIAAVYFWRKRRRKRQGLGSRLKNYKLTILLCF
jgi:hypothetical protein